MTYMTYNTCHQCHNDHMIMLKLMISHESRDKNKHCSMHGSHASNAQIQYLDWTVIILAIRFGYKQTHFNWKLHTKFTIKLTSHNTARQIRVRTPTFQTSWHETWTRNVAWLPHCLLYIFITRKLIIKNPHITSGASKDSLLTVIHLVYLPKLWNLSANPWNCGCFSR